MAVQKSSLVCLRLIVIDLVVVRFKTNRLEKVNCSCQCYTHKKLMKIPQLLLNYLYLCCLIDLLKKYYICETSNCTVLIAKDHSIMEKLKGISLYYRFILQCFVCICVIGHKVFCTIVCKVSK